MIIRHERLRKRKISRKLLEIKILATSRYLGCDNGGRESRTREIISSWVKVTETRGVDPPFLKFLLDSSGREKNKKKKKKKDTKFANKCISERVGENFARQKTFIAVNNNSTASALIPNFHTVSRNWIFLARKKATNLIGLL